MSCATPERKAAAIREAREGVLADPPEPDVPEWAERLTPGQAALMEVLRVAYPSVLSRRYLERHLPRRRTARASDIRDDKIVDVHISHVRAVLGQDAIRTVDGRGFCCGADFHKQYGATQ
jgi:DNA-binding winged helix-turn-helix (wHTH) protein